MLILDPITIQHCLSSTTSETAFQNFAKSREINVITGILYTNQEMKFHETLSSISDENSPTGHFSNFTYDIQSAQFFISDSLSDSFTSSSCFFEKKSLEKFAKTLFKAFPSEKNHRSLRKFEFLPNKNYQTQLSNECGLRALLNTIIVSMFGYETIQNLIIGNKNDTHSISYKTVLIQLKLLLKNFYVTDKKDLGLHYLKFKYQ